MIEKWLYQIVCFFLNTFYSKDYKRVQLSIEDVATIEAIASYFGGFNPSHKYKICSKYICLIRVNYHSEFLVLERKVLDISAESILKYCELISDSAMQDNLSKYTLDMITSQYDEFMKLRSKLI